MSSFAVATTTTSDVTNEGATQDDNNDSNADIRIFEIGSYLCLILSLTLPLLIIIAGKCYSNREAFVGCDKPNYMALFLFFWNVGDLYSDLIFCLILGFENSNLFYYSLTFLLFPYFLSFGVAIQQVKKCQSMQAEGPLERKIEFVKKYDWLVICITIFAGFYSAIELIRSNIFYLPMFSLQLRKREYSNIQSLRIWTTVVFEFSKLYYNCNCNY